ncbi:WD repeat domain phosphoinositide-interacting protein 3 [Leucoagaricus sp. SymC.cos]|nr:WD repeat domain phosphoinositide-interacting protein 3 [Leucoagaricus sp. SymC.cos]
MNLARHSISSAKPVHVLDARFDANAIIFTASTHEGFAVYRTWPLELVRKRELSNGTLSHVVPLHTTNLLFLVGGGRSPLYPPNKVVVWDDALGKEVAELEFKSQVRGLACRRGWLAVALRRRVAVFQIGGPAGGIRRHSEFETGDNPRGLLAMATAPRSTLLAIAGRQLGHVQLVHLPPFKSTTPIIAHSTALTTLSLTASGRLIATTSSKGTLVRIWDTATGIKVKELRRGTDKAEIYGVAFRPDEKEVCVWSDKGTVHVFSLGLSGTSNRQSTFSPLAPFIPLPKYFESEWSYAQYRIPVQSSHISLSSTRPAVGSSSLSSAPVVKDRDIPAEERCVVGWVQVATEDHQQMTEGGGARSDSGILEWQLIALTYLGGWYRLALPKKGQEKRREGGPGGLAYGSPPKAMSRRGSAASTVRGSDKSKEKEKEKEKESRVCVLQEYRRFGRWDGWG